MRHLYELASAATCLFAMAAAWNMDVHMQIGYMAERLLEPSTTEVILQILEPEYHGSIGRAAAWADQYAHTDEGGFSYQWHWIDSHDNPPQLCDVYYNRDCSAGGCIVSAIANQTEILRSCISALQSGTYGSSTNLTCSYALKWIVHFAGDITQPLHASGLAAGGNDYPVTFGNHSTELHAVWDGHILYADANVTSFPNTTLQPFFESILTRIQHDTFFSTPVSEWIACTDLNRPLECALSWARDSNAWTCNYVYSQVFNGTTDLLASGYAAGAFPIVELQTAKAAKRLSVWLSGLVDGSYKMDREFMLQTRPSWGGTDWTQESR